MLETSDICSPNPCKNAGKCVHAPKDSFDCVCVKGFTGPLCESKFVDHGSVIVSYADNNFSWSEFQVCVT